MNYIALNDAQKEMNLTPAQKDRFDSLVAMHHLVMSMNDENAYMTWIYLVPDEASSYDLAEIACDDEEFADVVACFKRLWKKYASQDDGLYIGKKTY